MAPRVTVLQLDTDFPRVPGDVGCAGTYLCEVEVIRIAGATVGQIVSARPDLIDIAPFEDALARAQGEVIVTSCGFLSYWQAHLAALTDRPFISSALTAVAGLSGAYAPSEVLTLTFDAASLTPQHFGAHPAFAKGVVGLPPNAHLRQVISQNLGALDVDRAGAEMATLLAETLRPDHRHILLECTNLPPYKTAMRRVTDLPITDILTCIEQALPGVIDPQFLT